jgi:hypothetical protein
LNFISKIDLDNAALVVVGGFERDSQRGHALVHEQKVSFVALARLAIEAIAVVAVVAAAHVLAREFVVVAFGLAVADAVVLVARRLRQAPVAIPGETLPQ